VLSQCQPTIQVSHRREQPGPSLNPKYLKEVIPERLRFSALPRLIAPLNDELIGAGMYFSPRQMCARHWFCE
jgi:hypothetical protein